MEVLTKKVTAIRPGRGRQRMQIFLDGKFAFSLDAAVIRNNGLQLGQELTTDQIEAMVTANQQQRCLDAAAHYLSYRPRSEFEIRHRLQRRGFDSSHIEPVVIRLKEQGLVDDLAFAQFWKENRESFSPRSQWLTRRELRQKGVAEDIIEAAVDNVDDDDTAYRAAQMKARRLPATDYSSFRYRLGQYLRRRGFNYIVINRVVLRLWQEWGENPSNQGA